MKNNHWSSLTKVAKRAAIFLLLAFAVCWFGVDWLYLILAEPILKVLPDSFLVSISLLNSILMPLQLSWYVSLGLTIPYFLFELWRFIAPALTKSENNVLWPIIFSSWFLFCLGAWFAYSLVFPIVFGFLVGVTPVTVHLMPDVMTYLEFCVSLILTFGSAAQLPLVMVVLTISQLVSLDFWLESRAYAILFAFVLGMLLTPPDVMSQVLLAIPLWCLYELGIVFIRVFCLNKLEK